MSLLIFPLYCVVCLCIITYTALNALLLFAIVLFDLASFQHMFSQFYFVEHLAHVEH